MLRLQKEGALSQQTPDLGIKKWQNSGLYFLTFMFLGLKIFVKLNGEKPLVLTYKLENHECIF